MINIDNFNLSDYNKDILREYKVYLLTEQHLLDNSISSYVTDIYKYLEYMEENKKNYSNIDKDDLIKYLGSLDNDNYSIYSVVRKISSIRKFHSFLSKKYRQEDITEYLENPRFYKKIPDVLSIEEVDMLLDIPLSDNFSYRNKAMIELMYATGLRVSELINLCMSALLDNGDEVLVPSPDYPLWTACVTLAGGTAVHYVCDEQSEWYPDIDDIRKKVNSNRSLRNTLMLLMIHQTYCLFPKVIKYNHINLHKLVGGLNIYHL